MQKRLVMVASILIVLAALAAGGLVYFSSHASTLVRERIIELLSEGLDSKVELKEVRTSLWPRLRVEGKGLIIRSKGRTDVPPLVSISRFDAQASWTQVFQTPRRVERMNVEGLQVTIPPRGQPGREKERGGCQAGDRNRHTAPVRPSSAPAPTIVVDAFTATNAQLLIIPRNPTKSPRVFLIHATTLNGVTLDGPMTFEAELTNPKPKGEIHSTGTFGPWQKDSPSLTPVSGHYVFEDADLGTIKGIDGTLASTGDYKGVLEQILVHGEASIPNFALTTGRHPMPLKTDFDTCVDGTDGDTYIDRADALLNETRIFAKGKVEGTVGVKGRTIQLEASIDDGKIEDLLRLAVKDEPLMTGRVSLKTSFHLPPGEQEVIRRLGLRGEFGVAESRFTSGGLQSKINEFSRRGRGDMEDPTADRVASDLRGHFVLNGGTMSFSNLAFRVPGAAVQLHGTYGLESEAIDLEGNVRLQARASEMTTGVKSALLKVIDPLFSRRDAGTVLPIHIAGTRNKPEFGVDIKGAILRRAK